MSVAMTMMMIIAICKRFRRLRNRQINLRQYIIDALTWRLKISTFVSKASKNTVSLMTQKTTLTLDRNALSYSQHLKNALKLFHQPEALGAESPLASPYFLGHALPSEAIGPHGGRQRGEILQAELLAAAGTFLGETPPRNRQEMATLLNRVRQDPEAPGYAYLVLELRCFQRFFKVTKTADIWEREEFLPGSRAEHYRDYDLAVDLLGDALLDRLRPTVRLEAPVQPGTPVGYKAEYERALQALRQGQSVTICGAGGVGKTTLAAQIAADPHFSATFWFTLRQGINDTLPSLLFAVAHFLREQGATALWRQFAVGQTDDLHLALGLLRKDLQSIDRARLLFCFDEMETLHAADLPAPLAAHRAILEFLRTLQGQLPLLYISQRPLLETDIYCELRGVESVQLATLLQATGYTLDADAIQQLRDYTQGNLRLVKLALVLWQPGATLPTLAADLPQTAAIQPIWQRIWQRLASQEQQLLQQLAVFRHAAPVDQWSEYADPLAHLTALALVQQDSYGGIELTPVLRDILYQQLPTTTRQQLHLAAGAICAARGDYTEAAYHYVHGGAAGQAVRIWHPQLRQELLRGKSGAAQAIFAAITRDELPRAERKSLDLILAELHQRHGEVQQGLAVLATEAWTQTDEADVRAYTLQGQLQEALGQQVAAEQSYGAGIQTLMRLQQNLVHLQCQRGLLHTRQRNTKLMRQYLLQARCETQRLQGMLEEYEGRFGDAHVSYQSALALAQSSGDHAAIATLQFARSRILGRLGNYEDALHAAHDAIVYCEASSDWLTLAHVYANLAAAHKDAGHLERAIDAAHKALPLFKMMNAPYWIGLTAVNLAEAYFDLGELANSETYAQVAITQNAPHSMPYALFALARVRKAQGTAGEAKALFQRSLHTAQENEDRFMEAYAQRALGELYHNEGRFAEAERYLQQALRLFEQVEIDAEVAATQSLLDKVAAMRNGLATGA